MFQSDQTLQPSIFAFSHRDLVDKDSDVWLYIDLFDHVDISDFDSSYSYQGQAAKDPKLMLRTIFYALTHGINSGHKLAEVSRNDNRFIVLSGDTRPDRRTYDRFIRRHEKNLDALFVQLVHIATAMGLVSLGRVAIDGSRFRAYANGHMRYEKMERAIQHIRDDLNKLKKDLQTENSIESTQLSNRLEKEISERERRIELIKRAKEQIDKEYAGQVSIKSCKKDKRKPNAIKTLHDPEALSFGASAKFSFGYNLQAAVDDKSQIVVAAEVHDSSADSKALPVMLESIKENTGSAPEKVLADNGYYSYENLKAIKDFGSIPYVSVGAESRESEEKSFEQISKKGQDYYCLAGHKLNAKTKSVSKNYAVLDLTQAPCSDCPMKDRCRSFSNDTVVVHTGKKGSYLRNYLKRSKSKVFKEIYRNRKRIVEPVFGNIKNKGHKIYVRGTTSVKSWWRLVCSAHNIEKIVKTMAKTGFQPA